MLKMHFILSLIFSLTFLSNTQAQWKQTNGPYGTVVYSLAVNDSCIYAGTFNDGIYLSTDDGASWNPANKGIEHSYIQMIVLNGSKIFAGTIDGLVYLSTDKGNNWQIRNNGLTSKYLYSLAVKDKYIFAGTSDKGVFRSSDDGKNWVPVNSGLDNQVIFSLAVMDSSILAGTRSRGVFISKNNGDTWQALDQSNLYTTVNTLTVKDSLIFAGTDYGVYYTTLHSKIWNRLNSDGVNGMENYAEIKSIAVKGDYVFAGAAGTSANGLYRYSISKLNWTLISNGLTNNTVFAVAVKGNKVFAATYGGGVYVSVDNGERWEPSNIGLVRAGTTALSAARNTLFAGTSGGGIFISSDSGLNWKASNDGITLSCMSAFCIKDSLVFAAAHIRDGYKSPLYVSSNMGKSWSSVKIKPFYYGIYSLAADNKYVYVGSDNDGLYRSSDNGQTWAKNEKGPFSSDLRTMLAGNNIVMTGSTDGIFITSDHGENWTFSLVDSNYCAVQSIAVNDSGIFAGTVDRDVFLSKGVSRSLDMGKSWVTVSNGLKSRNVTALSTYDKYIFAGTNKGVFVSCDNGRNWDDANTGLSNLYTTAFVIWRDTLYASTSEGVWYRPLNEFYTSIQHPEIPLPEAYQLKQNYPNPFNPATKISYSLPERQNVKLTIYDILGKEVSTLVNEYKEAGNHTVQFSASSLPSGIYIYKIQAGQFRDSKKLIILK